MQCTVLSVQCAVYSVMSAVCSTTFAVCSVQCAMCSVKCAVCSAQWENLRGQGGSSMFLLIDIPYYIFFGKPMDHVKWWNTLECLKLHMRGPAGHKKPHLAILVIFGPLHVCMTQRT